MENIESEFEKVTLWNTAVGNYFRCGANATLEGKLLREECEEMIEAIANKDPVEMLDGAADILFVMIGSLHKAGFDYNDLIYALSEVTKSNFTKLPFTKNAEGKVQKSDRYKAPDLSWCTPMKTYFKEDDWMEHVVITDAPYITPWEE